MRPRYPLILASSSIAILVAAGQAAQMTGKVNGEASQRGGAKPPAYEVDPLWPKPLPNHWILGSVTGVAVDARDHIWVVHRGAASLNTRTEATLQMTPPGAEACCAPAPQVLEFDAAGTLLAHWGGPGQGYDWASSPGGITVDAKGNVWIAAAGQPPPRPTGRGGGATAGGATGAAQPGASGRAAATPPAPPPPPADAHVLKFSPDGKFLLQIGKAGQTGASDSKTSLNRPASIDVDTAGNEVYVADGHVNRRVAVFDATTGAYKRHWGAYGTPPDDAAIGAYDPAAPPAKQFRTVSCVQRAKDGTVYVCDRQNDRIQAFKSDGTFVKEGFVSKTTTGEGAVWDIAFSNDPQQQFLFVADGHDKKIFILQRSTLEVVGSFGTGGRQPGQFFGVGSVAVDSQGNVYTGETYEGKRVQKFIRR